jgi:uncharacterized protein DUF4258
MDRGTAEAFIRTAAHRGGSVLWSRHAIARLVVHRLSREEVEMALGACTIIEEYPDGHRALPDCLVLAWLRASEPFHAVIAVDTPNDRVFVVTVYRPDPARWFDDWIRRRL